MAERRAEIVSVEHDTVALRALADCSDCSGCGGRCNLFLSDASGMLELSGRCFAETPAPGDQVVLVLADGWLLRSALRGYGLPLLGLLAGGASGHALAALAQLPVDLGALCGACAGTFAAFTLSKAHEPHIAVRTTHREFQ